MSYHNHSTVWRAWPGKGQLSLGPATARRTDRTDRAFGNTGRLVGLATYTRHLDAWPLISPAYFERRWPVQYAAKSIWYCGFVAVDQHTAGAYMKLVEALYRTAEAQQGVIGLDVCRFNDDTRHISRSIGVLLRRVSGGAVRPERADEQSFWIYETGTSK